MTHISSGSSLINLLLSGRVDGGFMVGRISNIVGDSSSAKTGVAIEAMANYTRAPGKHLCVYAEAEAAFTKDYAETCGLVDGSYQLKEIDTIEAMCALVDDVIKQAKDYDDALVIVDSLDAISSKAEQKRELGEATYGTEKSKLLSEFFRTRVAQLQAANVTLIIISQTRDNLSPMAHEKSKRAGGRALQFYCTNVIWLTPVSKLKKTVGKQDFPYGIEVRCKDNKNKQSTPYMEFNFTYLFNYGIDDIGDCVAYLVAREKIQAPKGWITWDEKNYRLDDFRAFVVEKGDIYEQLKTMVQEAFDEQLSILSERLKLPNRWQSNSSSASDNVQSS